MFTRAGFNPRYSDTGIRARVSIIGGTRAAIAKLIRFRSGDLAWYRPSYLLCWGLRANISGLRNLPLQLEYGTYAYSDVRSRRSFNMDCLPGLPKPKKAKPTRWTQPDLLGSAA